MYIIDETDVSRIWIMNTNLPKLPKLPILIVIVAKKKIFKLKLKEEQHKEEQKQQNSKNGTCLFPNHKKPKIVRQIDFY